MPPSSVAAADREPVRYGIRFLLAMVALALASLTAGITISAYLSLSHLQSRMEELAEGNLEEITLAGRLHDSTAALLRPISQMAELPGEVPNTAALNGVRMQLKEVRGTAETLAARLAETGAAGDRARMIEARRDLAATEKAFEDFAAATARRNEARLRSEQLLKRLETLFDQHFEQATRTENQMRAMASQALAVSLPEAAEQGRLQARLDSVFEREMAWLGIAQDLRTDARELLSIVRAMEHEDDAARLLAAQRDLELYATRLTVWRRLPDSDTVRALGKATDALVAALTASPSLQRARTQELAAEAGLAASAKGMSEVATRLAGQARAVAGGLSHDVRGGIQQARAEVQQAQATLTVVAIAATLAGILLVYGVVTRRIIFPLERVTRSMRRAAAELSGGKPDWQTALVPPATSGNDEVAAMYQALRVFRDILVRRQEEVEGSRAQLLTILATINEAVQLWDKEGRLVYCNTVARHLLGISAEEPPTEERLAAGWQYRREDGTPFQPEDFPHARALKYGTVQTGVVMQVINPAGIERWLLVNAQPVRGGGPGELHGVVTSCSDISDFKRHQSELEHLAHHDPLTQLPNRALLEDRLEQAINQADRNGSLLAVCYLDLDGFKPINDQFGHAAGDLLLQEVALRLKANLRGGDTVARLGGDEFVLLLAAIDDIAECQRTLRRVLQNLCAPCTLCLEPEACATVTASIGVTIYPIDHSDSNALLRHADHAMYLAKQSGKNAFHIFYPEAGPPAAAGRLH